MPEGDTAVSPLGVGRGEPQRPADIPTIALGQGVTVRPPAAVWHRTADSRWHRSASEAGGRLFVDAGPEQLYVHAA